MCMDVNDTSPEPTALRGLDNGAIQMTDQAAPKYNVDDTVYLPEFKLKGTVTDVSKPSDASQYRYGIKLHDLKHTETWAWENNIQPESDLPKLEDTDDEIDAMFGAAVEEQDSKPKKPYAKKDKKKKTPKKSKSPVLQIKDGNIVAVTMMRRMAVAVLEAHDPDAFAKYGEIKYANGLNPSLEDRMAAYEFAIKRALEIGYKTANA